LQPPACLKQLFTGKLATHKEGKAELLITPLLGAGSKNSTVVVLTCSFCEIAVFLQKNEGYCFLKVHLSFLFFVLRLCPSAGTVSSLPCQNYSDCVVL
jgi:hypothetical protein